LPRDSSSGAASSITTLAPCSCAANAAQNAALPAPTTITSALCAAIRLLRRLRGAAMRFRPGSGVFHELFDLPELAFVEGAALLGRLQNVPPCGERVQRHAELAHDLLALRKDIVEEKYEDMLDHGAGLAQCLAEVHLAAPVRGHVFDQEHAVAGLDMAFDLRVTAE